MSAIRLAGLLAVFVSGCAVLPQPPPVIPERGEHLILGVTVGQVIAPVRAIAASPASGSITVHDSREGSETPPLTSILDPRLSFVYAQSAQLDWSAHLSLTTMGVELRVLPVGSQGSAPLVLALGAQSDGVLILRAGEESQGRLSGEVRTTASVHPVLGRGWRAMVGAGFSLGPRRRFVILPGDAVGMNQVDNQYPPAMNVVRSETRAEALAGIAWSATPKLRLVLATQPFWVVSSGATTAVCRLCDKGAVLLSYENHWGVAITLSGFFTAPR